MPHMILPIARAATQSASLTPAPKRGGPLYTGSSYPSASRMASTSSSRQRQGTPRRLESDGRVLPSSPLSTSLTYVPCCVESETRLSVEWLQRDCALQRAAIHVHQVHGREALGQRS